MRLEQSEILYHRLLAAGVPATLIVVSDSGHGFVPVGDTARPNRSEITHLIADFFDKYLKC